MVYYPASVRGSLAFWSHQRAQAIPNNTWTPLVLNNLITTRGGVARWTNYVPAATTIAAGSDAQALPQATINVASTSGFAAASASNPGFIVIEISGVDRVVQYTGLTATSFTGCTLGVGTMTLGDNVRQANVHFFACPSLPAVKAGPQVAEVAFVANATNDRGIRFRSFDGVFNFPAGTKTERACATQVHHVQTTDQLVGPLTGQFNRIEVFQDSGGTLNTVVEALSAPRLVAMDVSSFSYSGVNT